MRVPALATTMRYNGFFSASSGATAIATAIAIDRPFGLEPWLMAVIGIGLVGYGVQLMLWARNSSVLRLGAGIATVADAIWVVSAAIIILGFPSAMTDNGRIVLGVLSLLVAEFAVLQLLGLSRRTTPVPTT